MAALYDTLTSLGTTELLIASTVFILSYLFMSFYKMKGRNLPPGPIGFPILGCMFHIRKDPHLKLQEMASKYGDVFSMYLGSQLVVVLNGVDAIKEGMSKAEFMSRPPKGPFSLGDEDIPNIATISGKEHQDQRKFILHSMRDLGFGKTVLEECMKAELEYFLQALDHTKGKPFDVSTILSPSVSNNITALLYGTRFDYDDPRRKYQDNFLMAVQEFIGQTTLHTFLPWIAKIPLIKQIFGYHRVNKLVNDNVEFVSDRIEEHKKTLDPNHTRDYIDKYLVEMKRIRKTAVDYTSFTEKMLIGNAGALMGAGTETVNVTLRWCFFLMAVFQEVQKKVHEEIENVVGSARKPAWLDQRQMPYTQAVIMEIMRWRTIIPLNLLRYTFEDTIFGGYDIPKDTIILANLWSAHYDVKYWKEPEKFHPERFLSDDMQRIVKSEAYMPFSVGRRSCPGEVMAVVEVFIYFTHVLQLYNITLPRGVAPNLEGLLKLALYPKPYDLCFISRSSK